MENKEKIFITGIAGFIGFHLAKELAKNYKIIGLDNLNNYYDIKLKKNRLKELGITVDGFKNEYESKSLDLTFYKYDLLQKNKIDFIFNEHEFKCVIHLAAQAGVRYSISNPKEYIDSNIIGFYNILESMKLLKIKNLIYASSSSVYGEENTVPFNESFPANDQISLYAATKKTNEILAKTYSNLYNIKAVGLRFFTVYGPFGRPDMAYYKFSDYLHKNMPIEVYNYGKQRRDFTYIDDIVSGINLIIEKIDFTGIKDIYNIGSGNPKELEHMIDLLENLFNKKFRFTKIESQMGDVSNTYADISLLQKDFNFKIKTDFESGLKKFTDWYKKINNVT